MEGCTKGSVQQRDDGGNADADQIPSTIALVLDMCAGYMDCFYTSPQVAAALQKKGHYSCGTVQTN